MLKQTVETPRDGAVLEFKWTVSRGRDSYGYNIVTLRVDGEKVAACNGGGYDMKGTALGNWVAGAFSAELLKLKAADMPEQSHWEPDHKRICAGACFETYQTAFIDAVGKSEKEAFQKSVELPLLSEDTWECPTCKGKTRSSNGGKRIDDGRYFYGLTFHDPDFDPGKAVIGKGCNDRTLSSESQEGKTVGEAEAAGVSFGLERYQAIYQASSKQPSRRHRIPSIDGGCGFSSVQTIMRAVGFDLEYVKGGKSDDVYILRKVKKARKAKTAPDCEPV